MSNRKRQDGLGSEESREGGRQKAKKPIRKPKPPSPPAEMGRPPRLAHLLPDRHRRRLSINASRVEGEGSVKPAPLPPLVGTAPALPGPRYQVESGAETLCQPNPEWLQHQLIVTGPAEAVAMFRIAAAGSGRVPWQRDYERLEEDWIHQLLAPAPSERRISLQGAKIAARQMRTAVETFEMRLVDEQRHGRCPLDLNALIPVPEKLLSRGLGDAAVLTWLWENWGTTWPLRNVEEVHGNRRQGTAGNEAICIRFFSADWTPWRALEAIRLRWPGLTFSIKMLAAAE